jgi:hypothetical protein
VGGNDATPQFTAEELLRLKPCYKAFSSIHPAGVEPATFGFVVRRSIQLSYGC